MKFLIKFNNFNNIGISSYFKYDSEMCVLNERLVSIIFFSCNGWQDSCYFYFIS